MYYEYISIGTCNYIFLCYIKILCANARKCTCGRTKLSVRIPALLTITRCYKTQKAFCILHFTFLSLLSEHNQCDTLPGSSFGSVEGRPGLMSAGNGNLNEFTFALSRIFKAEMSSHSRWIYQYVNQQMRTADRKRHAALITPKELQIGHWCSETEVSLVSSSVLHLYSTVIWESARLFHISHSIRESETLYAHKRNGTAYERDTLNISCRIFRTVFQTLPECFLHFAGCEGNY